MFLTLKFDFQQQRSPSGLQQMSPLSLVTHGNAPNSHHRMMGGPPLGQMTNVVPHDIEQRMLEYIKMFQTPKEPRRNNEHYGMTLACR